MIIEILAILVIFFFVIELLSGFVICPWKTGKSYYHLMHFDFTFQYDSLLGYSLKPNKHYKNPTTPPLLAPRNIRYNDFRTDKNGFIFSGDIDKIKNKYKLIFCLGGSTTAGPETPYNKTYPAILDTLVKGKGYRCINAGVMGYRSIHEYLHFKYKVLPFKPNILIIFSGYNDFEDYGRNCHSAYDPFTHGMVHSIPSNKFQRILTYSSLFPLFKKVINIVNGRLSWKTGTKLMTSNYEKALKSQNWVLEYYNNISKIIELSKKSGIKCYLLSHASPCYENAPAEAKSFANRDLEMKDSFEVMLNLLEVLHSTANNLCEKTGVGFIDVRQDFDIYCTENGTQNYRKRFRLFTDRWHFTEEGNTLLAKSIYQKIKEEL